MKLCYLYVYTMFTFIGTIILHCFSSAQHISKKVDLLSLICNTCLYQTQTKIVVKRK